MPIIVHSPFSGKPVKVRDQDIGRAVRDEENRPFYVLQKSDGSGYYTSQTRVGGPKEEARYDKLVSGSHQTDTITRQEQVATFDQTGKKRGMNGKLLILILLIIFGVVAVVGWQFRGQAPADILPERLIPMDNSGAGEP